MPFSTGVKITQYAINGSAGLYTIIRGTITSRYAEIWEDASANGDVLQGLTYQLPTYADDGTVSGWGPPISVDANFEPATFGNKESLTPFGPILAQGPNVILGIGVTLGTPICRIRSFSATGTIINVTEYQ